jgi:hypothetical protein
MILYLLSSLFLSNKIYMAVSLNKHYVPIGRALGIVILATLLDDLAYYVFDNKYALSNFSFIFYLAEIFTSCLMLCIVGRIFGGSHKQLSFSSILKGFSYTLSPVIFGSIVLIILSLTTDLNTEYYDQMKLGAYLVITVWMWLCQLIFISTYFDRISGLNKIIMFALNVGIYLGMDKFKKFFYLFLSGLQ